MQEMVSVDGAPELGETRREGESKRKGEEREGGEGVKDEEE